MSITEIYFGITFGLAFVCSVVDSALFYCHVMTGLVDRGQRVGMDFSVVPFRRDRYVARYLSLLTSEERRTTANRLVRHLPWVTPTLGLLCLVGTLCIGARWR
ncbi:hypothetical protein [Xanthomonas vesicatoria]|uniref:hypothetical protein n=1 Tax=Xanthomonas vesicatoria TaxID=56460 RepID=UPI0009C1361F|nr:hypothetical protein [Xanthomonas vesicatoria]MCC8556962.1 hypothetical protein [Xanthomonas vesicatoria]MCC8599794.1 hypothetical protein [Xanthomonas vesicatoria]MCC8608227.1 hypothetical protein [Xanthomonas vesicatoria]MCC8674849.1 hypothetical protein [Xanthomonas vesicatoria]MCC8678782.1 hypothetical protein [Xanthomonas vesicatoria]